MVERHHRRRSSLIALLMTLYSLGGASSPAAAQASDTPTVIRYLGNHGSVATYEIADALGWLREKGIRIESEGYSQGGPESLVALASGSVDIAGAAIPAIINAMAAGAKLLAVQPNGGVDKDVNSKFFVLAGSRIRTAKDLQGKSIAVNTLGAHLDYTVREYLRNNGMTPDAVELITVPGPQLEQILRHRQADVVAAGAWQTVFAGKIAAGGGVRVVFTDYDVLGNIVLGADAMKTSFIAAHAQAVRDFVTTCARASDWTIQYPEQARKLVAEILQRRDDNPALAQYWVGYGLRQHALFTSRDADFWIDVLVRSGKLKPGQLSHDDIVTNKYNGFAGIAQK
jgi:ABC-type nitrate/sulfonate/bicarbonate transport system substrate-binding protein